MEKAFGQEEANRLAALARDSVESIHTAFYQTRTDLSVMPPQPMKTPPAALVYYSLTVRPGTMQQYIDASRKTREASLAVTPDSYTSATRKAARSSRWSATPSSA